MSCTAHKSALVPVSVKIDIEVHHNTPPGGQPPGPLTGHGGMMDFNIDFDTLDAFDNIDFGAFDQVFNSESWSWDMLSPLPELDVPLYGAHAIATQPQA